MRREILRTFVAVIAVYAVSLACSTGGSSGGLWVPGGQYPPAMSGDATGTAGSAASDTARRPDTATGQDSSSARDPGSSSLLDTLADIVPDAEAALNEPGSRLQLRVLEASDGARQFNGFHDSQLNEQCWFADTGQGRQHCIPLRVVYLGNYFADAGCTQRLGAAQGNSCGARFARWSEIVGCETVVRMHELGPAFPADTPAYYRNSDGECAEVNINRDLDWHRAGAELPLDTFVSASVKIR